MTSIPLKVYGTPESLLLQADHNREDIVYVHVSPAMSAEEKEVISQRHEQDSRFPSAVPVSSCFSPKAKVDFSQQESIHHFWEEGASMSSSASPAVLAVKYILDWEVLQLLIDTQPQ